MIVKMMFYDSARITHRFAKKESDKYYLTVHSSANMEVNIVLPEVVTSVIQKYIIQFVMSFM